MRALDISFIAYCCFVFLRSTFQTFPNPPFPMQYWYVNELLVKAKENKYRFNNSSPTLGGVSKSLITYQWYFLRRIPT